MPIASGVLWILHWCAVSALVSPGDTMLMCHTDVLECVTPTQDKFTPEKNVLSTQNHLCRWRYSKVRKIGETELKKHQSTNFGLSLEEDIMLGFFLHMMNVKQTPSLKAL